LVALNLRANIKAFVVFSPVYSIRAMLCLTAGHSSETIDGHAQFQTGLQPIDGYNGPYGYRRNNPWLRRQPSTFGVVTELPLH
jgi:hypothetical protein